MQYKESTLTCEMCGKKVKRILRLNSPKTYLCQNCAKKLDQAD